MSHLIHELVSCLVDPYIFQMTNIPNIPRIPSMSRVVAYYQDPDDLSDIPASITDIIACSLHFGYTSNKPYIHLNNHNVDAPENKAMWKNLDVAHERGTRISIMLGGAGKAYQTMFTDFETFYTLLHDVLMEHTIITGLDLDVEESIEFPFLCQLVTRLVHDFKDLELSMAPIASALIHPTEPGMGGFCYADVLKTLGKYIHTFHVQMYDDQFTAANVQLIMENHIWPTQLCVGMLGNANMEEILPQIEEIQHLCNDSIGGVFVWDYHTKPPNWESHVQAALTSNQNTCTLQ